MRRALAAVRRVHRKYYCAPPGGSGGGATEAVQAPLDDIAATAAAAHAFAAVTTAEVAETQSTEPLPAALFDNAYDGGEDRQGMGGNGERSSSRSGEAAPFNHHGTSVLGESGHTGALPSASTTVGSSSGENIIGWDALDLDSWGEGGSASAAPTAARSDPDARSPRPETVSIVNVRSGGAGATHQDVYTYTQSLKQHRGAAAAAAAPAAPAGFDDRWDELPIDATPSGLVGITATVDRFELSIDALDGFEGDGDDAGIGVDARERQRARGAASIDGSPAGSPGDAASGDFLDDDTTTAACRRRSSSSSEEAAFATLLRYLDSRGVTFRTVSQWEDAQKRRIVEQALPDDPIGQHQALEQWAERVEGGRLSAVGLTVAKLEGMDVVARLRSAITANDVDRTRALWERAIAMDVPMTVLSNVFSMTCRMPLLRPLAKDIRGALGARGRGFDIRFFTSLLVTCGSYAEVRRMMQAMAKQGIEADARAYAAAMKACEASPRAVRNILSNMKRANITLPGELHYSILLRSFGLSGMRREVLELWEYMQRCRFTKTPHTYAIMVKAVAPLDMEKAREVYEEAKRWELLSDRICTSYMKHLSEYDERVAIAKDFLRIAALPGLSALPRPMARALAGEADAREPVMEPAERLKQWQWHRDRPPRRPTVEQLAEWTPYRDEERARVRAEDEAARRRPGPERTRNEGKALWEVLAEAEEQYGNDAR